MKLKQILNEATLEQNIIKFGNKHNAAVDKLEKNAYTMIKRYIKLAETEREFDAIDAVIDEILIDDGIRRNLEDELSFKR